MMEKRMQEVGVRTSKEYGIEIFQDPHTGEGETTVYISPDQVDVVVKWLQEAKAELEGTNQK